MASLTTVGSNVPGMLSQGNIDLSKRPVVKNADGSISTVRSMSFNEDGKEILVPTVSPDGRILSENEAIDLYHKTGQNLGVFDTPDNATRYAESLHNQQADMYLPQASQQKKGVTLNIQGKKVKVDDSFLSLSPEEQNKTVDEIASQIGSVASPSIKAPIKQESPPVDNGGSILRSLDSAARGAADVGTFGLADEIAGTGNAVLQSLNPFRDYSKGFPSISEEIQKERDIQRQRDQQDPISSTAGRIAGGVAQGVGLAKAGYSLLSNAPKGAGLLSRAARGSADAALAGGAYGLGSGEGLSDRLSQGAGGAVAGAVIGGAVPVVAQGVKSVTAPVRNAIMARVNPGGYASEKIAERLANSNMTVEQAGNRAARDNLSLADVGGRSTRDLLRTATNIPGPARDKVGAQLALRQMGQGDRLKSTIGMTLADPEGFLAAKDDIAATAQKIAAPLFREAEKNPIHFTTELEGILNTPAGQQALRQAEVLAGNEQVPFRQLFFNERPDGSFEVKRVPDMRAWKYIKESLDDMVDKETDQLTKKVSNPGRIINNLKNRLLQQLDSQNPVYAEARKAWGGQQSLNKAMDFGKEAMTLSPEAVRRTIAGMGPAEKEAARAGAAEWLRNAIDQRSFTQNAILKFFSNRQQVQNLRSLFDNDAQFKTFRQAVFAEAKRRSTYEAVTGNSTTTRQLADMMESGGLKEGFDTAKTAITSGPVSAAIQFIGSRLRMLGGLTPEVANQIGQRLLSSNPANVQRITAELAAIERGTQNAAQKAQLTHAAITRALQAPIQSAASQPQ